MDHYQGRYADGRTATLYEVTIRLSASDLFIEETTTATLLAIWPIRHLRKINDDPPGIFRLRCVDDEAARLTVFESHLFTQLAQAGATLIVRRSWPKRIAIVLSTILLILAFIGAGIWGWPRLADIIAGLLPENHQQRLGASAKTTMVTLLAKIYHTEPRFCTSEAGVAALNKMIAQIAVGFSTPMHFKADIADVRMVNAFALPGGEIVITSGLIKFAENPEEIAAVLSHEMAHAIHHHPIRGMVRAMGHNILITMLFGSNIGSSLGEAVLNGAYTRDMEAEADRDGLIALHEVGIKNLGLATFFKRLRDKEEGYTQYLSLLSTHPSFEDRITAAESIQDRPNANSALDTKEWESLRKVCDQTKPLED
ncbi:MAG: M48 family metallopeptidase [Alphaproteobacteria bacterium]